MSDEEITEKNLLRRAKKKLKQPKIDLRSDTEREIDSAIEESGISARRQTAKQKRLKYGGIAGGILLLCFLLYLMSFPQQGTVQYAICRQFLELYTPYPTTLRLNTVDQFENSVRIWYVQIDPFGEYQMEPMQCFFKEGTKGRYEIEKITIDRREIDPVRVKNFNVIIPSIVASDPDRDLPHALPDSLADVNIQTDRFRPRLF